MKLSQLAQYNGKKNEKTYLSCKGIVFDVSSSDFYTGDGNYNCFSGKDCSVNLAKMSFDEKDYNQYNNVELTLSEKDILDQWYEKFYQKYPIVAKISETRKDN
ncbi:hypothetical protein IMG5_193720 [Ichthyophthirius multifiliis]|uniref:Cytochrome b5 heme-binding domain-containing protein n=1 Tax=Ichthyophthirius multifiliis TaxID=5932 RepID=G0R4L2_ICHMU|nr:hypothetical protein IMG5_193720 [Ichthyophthirius multifiliis]EGR27572.1 hypothetical protein IMG5_193720 [Ichthyophthirius multifiliis]|eukprot:XP_004025024.1 hypothetical protein IMG5_193720 [Ichthyophthirius multifiliis]